MYELTAPNPIAINSGSKGAIAITEIELPCKKMKNKSEKQLEEI
jgi:hypothetical protein